MLKANYFALILLAIVTLPTRVALGATSSGTLSGAAENPPNGSPGTGTTTVVYTPTTHMLDVSVTFTGLVGTTTAAHIHCCVAAPANVGVATPLPTFPGFPAGVSSGSYHQSFDLTQASSFNAAFVTANGGVAGAEAALVTGLATGRAYLNIHSTSFPGGEIRTFLQPSAPVPGVPLPGLVGLVVLLLALGAWLLTRAARAGRSVTRAR